MFCYLDVLETLGDVCIDDMFQAIFKNHRFYEMDHQPCEKTGLALREGMKNGDRFDNPEK